MILGLARDLTEYLYCMTAHFSQSLIAFDRMCHSRCAHWSHGHVLNLDARDLSVYLRFSRPTSHRKSERLQDIVLFVGELQACAVIIDNRAMLFVLNFTRVRLESRHVQSAGTAPKCIPPDV